MHSPSAWMPVFWENAWKEAAIVSTMKRKSFVPAQIPERDCNGSEWCPVIPKGMETVSPMMEKPSRPFSEKFYAVFFLLFAASIHSAGETNHFDRIASWCISNKIEDWESQTCACSRWPLAHAPKPGMVQSCHRWEGVYAWTIFVEKLRHFIQQGWDWSVGRDPTIWFRKKHHFGSGILTTVVGSLSIFREYTRIYVVIDLKVLVRSFNCESRACYVGNLCGSFFSSSRK